MHGSKHLQKLGAWTTKTSLQLTQLFPLPNPTSSPSPAPPTSTSPAPPTPLHTSVVWAIVLVLLVLEGVVLVGVVFEGVVLAGEMGGEVWSLAAVWPLVFFNCSPPSNCSPSCKDNYRQEDRGRGITMEIWIGEGLPREHGLGEEHYQGNMDMSTHSHIQQLYHTPTSNSCTSPSTHPTAVPLPLHIQQLYLSFYTLPHPTTVPLTLHTPTSNSCTTPPHPTTVPFPLHTPTSNSCTSPSTHSHIQQLYLSLYTLPHPTAVPLPLHPPTSNSCTSPPHLQHIRSSNHEKRGPQLCN